MQELILKRKVLDGWLGDKGKEHKDGKEKIQENIIFNIGIKFIIINLIKQVSLISFIIINSKFSKTLTIIIIKF